MEEKEKIASQAKEDQEAGTLIGQFSKMPWFDGPENGVTWSRPPRVNGQMPSPFGTSSKMMAENLSLPSSTVFLASNVQMKSDDEYKQLIEQTFDDIAHTNTGGAEYAKSWYERRVGLEIAYFAGKGCSLQVKQRYQEDGTGGEDRFQVRVVGESFALATRVVNTREVDEMYERIAADAQEHDFRSMSGQVMARIEGAKSVEDCDRIMGLLGKLMEKYIADRRVDRERTTRSWTVMCTARRDVLVQEEALANKAKQEDGKDDEEEEEEQKPEKKKEEEVASRPIHVIGLTSAILERRADVGPLFLSSPQRGTKILVPEAHPTFAPVRDYIDEDVKAKEKEADVVVPLADMLEKAKLGQEEQEKPAAAVVQQQKKKQKEVTRFDRITNERIKSTLQGINLSAGCTSGKWRDLKTPVTIPCTMSARGNTVLVVDHEKARVLLMPSGQESGEEYRLTDSTGAVAFKAVGCSIDDYWILILGYRVGQNTPTLVTISRHLAGQVRVHAFSTSIPMVSAILSENATASDGSPSMLIGFIDGTLLRLPVHPTAGTKSTIMMIAPTAAKHAKMISEDGGGEYAKLKKQYQKKKKAVYAVPFNGDEVMWCGQLVPLTRIVEHGKRIVASSPVGLHVFKLNIPEYMGEGEKRHASERIAYLALEHNASFDFRGNILAILKVNNSVELVNLHTYKLDACLGAPTGLNPTPPDIHVECDHISIRDERILFMHGDGSYRSLELNDYNLYTGPLVRSKKLTDTERAASFLSSTPEKGKGSKGKGNKKNKAKKGK